MRSCFSRAIAIVLSIFVIAFLAITGGCASAPPVKKDITYAFFPPPPDEPRYQFLTSFSNAKEMGEEKRSGLAEHVLGVEEEEKYYEVIKPFGINIRDGKIYVCDTKQHAVDVLDLKEKKFSLIGTGSSGQLQSPADIYIDDDGKKYVADTGWNKVLIFDQNGQYLDAFGDSEKMKPVNVMVMGNDILVSDYKGGEIEVWDKQTLKYKYCLGEPIGAKVAVRGPVGLAKDEKSNIYVVESFAFQIAVFDQEGHKLRSFGQAGDSYGQFARPKGIGVDKDGRIYVVDAAFSNVQVFDPDGKTLTFVGEPGGMPGQLIMPAEVRIDYQHNELFKEYVHPNYTLKFILLVTSQFGPKKVSVYGYVEKKK
jgi:DNA-binding beta-propeller fold protein YncE